MDPLTATWLRPVTVDLTEPAEVVGAKARGLVTLQRLGLPVPPAWVVTAEACREFLGSGAWPDRLRVELAAAVDDLAGRGARTVSVRSGASVSMPGMMDTVLDVPPGGVESAVEAVFASWETPRARAYRSLNGIADDLGTAVIVQAMVHGDRDEHSGSGVVLSRNPNTGERVAYGDVLFGRPGSDVVSGTAPTLPIEELADREPGVWEELTSALERVEHEYGDACYLEFTFSAGELWLLQARRGRYAGAAGIRVAAELVDEGLLDRRTALLRVSARDLDAARVARIDPAGASVVARGVGASPGVATGRLATSSESAVGSAGATVLVRPETSPHDVRGLAASVGVITATGGPASHAAVVARSMGRPAVVGVAGLQVSESGVALPSGERLGAGTVVTIDGGSGEVALGEAAVLTDAAGEQVRRLLAWADEISGGSDPSMSEAERLAAAHAVLRR